MKHGMRLGDFLDLEWFLEQDRMADPAATLARDRRFGLEAQERSVPTQRFGQHWLARRRAETDHLLPSAVLASFMAILRWALGLGGLLAGISLARGLLLYAGLEPVNVSVFLLLAVAPQSALCLLAAVLLLVRDGKRLVMPVFLRPLIALFWHRHGRLSAQAGFARTLVQGRGWAAPMLAWDSLRLLHLGGLSLALGTLAGTLASVVVTDLAFGWQSTLRVGAEGMLGLVSVLALPWSWLPAEWGLVPTLSQIEGSRIVLKDGMATLASADLIAWWPFLCMSLLFYALLPRLALLGVAHRGLRRLEEGFVHPDLARVADRMRSPVLASSVVRDGVSRPLSLADAATISRAAGSNPQAGPEQAGCVLLLPPELEGRIAPAELAALALRVCGYPLSRVLPVNLEEGQIEAVLARCADLVWVGGHERFLVLVEAWQPPIRENLQALRRLGHEGNRSLTLALAGRPAGGQWLVAPDQAQVQVWTEALARLAPLRVSIFGVQP